MKVTIKKIKHWVSKEMFGYSFTLPQFEVYAEHEGKNYFQTFIGFDKLEAKNKMKSLILTNKIKSKYESRKKRSSLHPTARINQEKSRCRS